MPPRALESQPSYAQRGASPPCNTHRVAGASTMRLHSPPSNTQRVPAACSVHIAARPCGGSGSGGGGHTSKSVSVSWLLGKKANPLFVYGGVELSSQLGGGLA